MKIVIKYLLFLILGCSLNIKGVDVPSFNIYFRLNEKSEYKLLNNSKLSFEQNVQLSFEDNENDLIFTLKDKPITSKTEIVKETSSLKVLKRDNSLIKEYIINIEKSQLSSTYLPFLIETNYKSDVVELVDINNILPSEEEGFNSNILEVFFKDDAKELLTKRIKKIYYTDTSKDKDLDDKNNAIEVLKPISEIIKNNYRITATKDKFKGKLGIKLYGLEYFEEDNKENLIALGDKLLTSVKLPWLTLADDASNYATIDLNEFNSVLGKIKFRPTKYKFIGFKGKVQIRCKTKEDEIISSIVQDENGKLFKFYKAFDKILFENINIGKIEFKFIYDDNNSYTFDISIPNIVLKYRTNDKEEKYTVLPYNTEIFNQNIELILEGEDGDLYVDNELINKVNGKISTILKKPLSNIKIKSKVDESLLILRECEIKIEKENIDSYAAVLIKNEDEKLTALKEDTNSLPSEAQGFNSNILEIFIKSTKKDLLKNRIKKLYYIDTSDDNYNFENKSSAKEMNLENTIINGFKVTKDRLNSKLGIKLYGLEYFEEEGEGKKNLVSLGNELLTSTLAPLITLEDELGNITTLNINEVINSTKTIDFNPTKFSIAGFKGNLKINYIDSNDNNFFLYEKDIDDKFIKESSNFKFEPTIGANVKEIQFKFIYSSNSSFTTTIKAPSYILKYKLKDNDSYQNFDYNSTEQFNQNVKIKLETNDTELYYSLSPEDLKVQEQNEEISLVVKNSINLKIKSKDKNKLLKTFKINVVKEQINSAYFPYLVKSDNYGIRVDLDEDNILPSKTEGFNSNMLEIHIKNDYNLQQLLAERIKAVYYIDSLTAAYDLNSKKSAKIMPISLQKLIESGFSIASKVIKGDLGLKLYGLEYLDEVGENQENLIALGNSLLTSASTPLVFLEKESGAGEIIDAKGAASFEKTIDFKPLGYTIGGCNGYLTILKDNIVQSAGSISSLSKSGALNTDSVKTIKFIFQYNAADSVNNLYILTVILPS